MSIDSDIIWDVYQSPRLDPVQFGKFRAAPDRSRSSIIRAVKYNRRGHRTSAFDSRKLIRAYLVSPAPNKGQLDASLERFNAQLRDKTRSEEQHKNDKANVQTLKSFLEMWDENQFRNKDFIKATDRQGAMDVGGVAVRLDLDCLVKSRSRGGDKRLGAIFLNTQKGEGLGSNEDTVAKRSVGGEAVSLLVLKRLQDDYADFGTSYPKHCDHIYIRSQKIWSAPESFTTKLKDI